MRFSKIPGQEELKKSLIKTVQENRISHAQLFLGSEGSAKLPMAIAYAQYICCPNRKEDDACGECPSCKKIENLSHPDLHFLFPVIKQGKNKETAADYLAEWREFLLQNDAFISLNQWHDHINAEKKKSIISTDDCHELIRIFNMKSYESEYKIMIIWMAERIYHAAAPKILKILEEPYDKSVFILIAEDQGKILKTILSRTQLVKFKSFKDEDVIGYLKTRFNKENHIAHSIAVNAEGNLSKAIQLASDEGDDTFNFSAFRNWMLHCYKADFIQLKTLVSQYASLSRDKQIDFLKYGLQLIRNSLLITYENTDLIRVVEEEKNFVLKFSKMINNKNAALFIDEFNEGIFHIGRNANANIVFMDISLKCIQFLKIK